GRGGPGMGEGVGPSDRRGATTELFIEALAGAAAARGRAAVALTGGSTAPPLYPRLRAAPVPWSKTHVFFTDERAVPPDHELSNYRLAEGVPLRRVHVAAAQRTQSAPGAHGEEGGECSAGGRWP